MKSGCTFLAWLGTLALSMAPAASALTIGRAESSVLLGRPLSISVPVHLDRLGDALPECVSADVFYGDTRVPARLVTTDTQRGPHGAVLSIGAGMRIDEPVVTVYLHVGCQGRYTRRIVLFAEVAPDELRQPTADSAGQGPAGARMGGAVADAQGRARPPRADRVALPVRAASPPAAADAPAGDKRSDPGAAAPRRSLPQQRGPAAGQKPRLQLEPVAAVEPHRLRMSTQLAQRREATPQERAAAAAAWRALNLSPDEVARATQRLDALDRDMGALRADLDRLRAAWATQGQRQADWRRSSSFQVAAAMAAAVALAVFWLWLRARSAPRGSRKEDHLEPSAFGTPVAWTGTPAPRTAAARVQSPDAAAHAGVQPAAFVASPAPAAAQDTPGAGLPGDGAAGAGTAQALERAVASGDGQREAGAISFVDCTPMSGGGSAPTSGGAVPFILDDALPAAEALEPVMASAVDDKAQSTIRAALDLLAFLHGAGRRDEFEAFRLECQRRLDLRVPSFDSYPGDAHRRIATVAGAPTAPVDVPA